MESYIGIDFGGTSIVGGVITSGRIVRVSKEATRATEGGAVTMDVLKSVIRSLMTDDTAAIGIGVPSVVDRKEGVVYNVQNIAGWDEVPLKSILEAEFRIPVYLDNDANCFACGEKVFGKGKPFENFVGVTLGTGLGAGIIQCGHLLSDANCGSGEFGEFPYLCGKLEDYCASRFFPEFSGLSGTELAVLANSGSEAAIKCFCEYGKHLSNLIKFIVLSLDPEAVIFGGSIAKSFDFFAKSIWDNLSDFPYPNSIKKLRIEASDLENSGILGAASLCVS